MGCCGDSSCDRPVVRCQCELDCWLDYEENDYAACVAECPPAIEPVYSLTTGSTVFPGYILPRDSSCETACKIAKASAVDACDIDSAACINGCEPEEEGCVAACEDARDACVEDAYETNAACVTGCASAAAEEYQSERTSGSDAYDLACGTDLSECLSGCNTALAACMYPRDVAKVQCIGACETTHVHCIDGEDDGCHSDKRDCITACGVLELDGWEGCVSSWRSCRGGCGNSEFQRDDAANGKHVHCGGSLYQSLIRCEGGRDAALTGCTSARGSGTFWLPASDAKHTGCAHGASAGVLACRWEACLEQYPAEWQDNQHERAQCRYDCELAQMLAKSRCYATEGDCLQGCFDLGTPGCMQACEDARETCINSDPEVTTKCAIDCDEKKPDCMDCFLYAMGVYNEEQAPIYVTMLGTESGAVQAAL